MITQFRIGLRLGRFEFVAAVIAVAVLTVSALVVRARLDAVGVSAACWDAWFGPMNGAGGTCTPVGPDSPARAFLEINEYEAGKVMAAMALLPLAVGLFLGVGLVAREIEGGTAPTVWALARSRSRWLAGRLLAPLAIVVLLLAALAISSDVLWAGREPWSPALRFGDAGLHGPVIVAKGAATLGLAMLAGAVIGRILPAVIVAAALALTLYLGGQVALDRWLQDEAPRHVAVMDLDPDQSVDPTMAAFPGGTYFSEWWQTADGRLLDDQAAQALVPAGEDPWTWLYANETRVMTGVPGMVYPEWARLETAGFGAVAIGAIAATFLVVLRRRPL